MVDLNCDTGTIFMNLLTEFIQTRKIVVMVDTKLGSSVGTLRRVDTCVFHDDQASAAFRTIFIIIDMKKTHFAVLFAVIGSHRHHNYTVFDRHIFYSKRGKNMLVIAIHYVFPPGIFLLNFIDLFDVLII